MMSNCSLSKKAIGLFLFTLCFYGVFAQSKGKIINNEATSFELQDPNGPIEFIVLDSVLDTKKPLFLWCQGSLPYPLYFNYKKEGLTLFAGGVTNFDYREIVKHYHLVVISMPETPLIVDESDLNDSYWYYGDSDDKRIPSLAYQRADHLDNYVDRAIKVLEFLRKQTWVDNSKLIAMGHSQGSHVASKLAVTYQDITKLGVSGMNPFGRIDQVIRQAKKDADSRKITWEQAANEIEAQYRFYRDAHDPEMVRRNPNLKTWKSFSVPSIDYLLAFDRPIYMMYGTADAVAELCDLVPLYFIRGQKENLSIKRYPYLEHNYFEVLADGTINYDQTHWAEVMTDFLAWTLID